MYLPKGILQREQLAATIADVEKMLGEDVVYLRFTIGEDWSDQPAIYFRILLTDQASQRDRLHQVATRIRAIIEKQIDPLDSWDLVPYYSFRSQSEQEMLKEATWA
jgi:hypothetical protein